LPPLGRSVVRVNVVGIVLAERQHQPDVVACDRVHRVLPLRIVDLRNQYAPEHRGRQRFHGLIFSHAIVLSSLLGYFLSPAGVLVLAALDSSLIFSSRSASTSSSSFCRRKPELFWLYALLGTAGALAGAAVTYSIGRAHQRRAGCRPVPVLFDA